MPAPNCTCKKCGKSFYTKPSQIRLRNGGQHCSRACWYETLRERRKGVGTPNFKGDDAAVGSGRARARRAFALEGCERCPAPAVERHHKDGNTKNNARENIELLCRRCHMEVDGRLAALVQARPRKLSDEQVLEIKKRLRSASRRGVLAQLAREFGVVETTIRSIRDGRTHTRL